MKQAYIIEQDEVMQALAQMYKDYNSWAARADDEEVNPDELPLLESMRDSCFKEFNGALEFLVLAGVFDSWAKGLEAVNDYIYQTR